MNAYMPVFLCVCSKKSRFIDNFEATNRFTFQLYFVCSSPAEKLPSICLYACTVPTYVQYIYDIHSPSDLIGGATNRETNVKLRKQSSCQNWRFLSPFAHFFSLHSSSIFFFFFLSQYFHFSILRAFEYIRHVPTTTKMRK